MPDLKISALPSISGADLATNDLIPVVDVSAPTATKRVTRTEFFQNVPLLHISSAGPNLRFIETDGGSGFETTFMIRNANTLSVQTYTGETAVSTDTQMVFDATGAITHTWRISNSEKLRVHTNGFLGVNTAAPQVQLHVVGDTLLRGMVYTDQQAPAVVTGTATLTPAQLMVNIINYTGAAGTLTLPTAVDMIAALPTGLQNLSSFDFSIINTGSGSATIASSTGFTQLGSLVIAAGTSGWFRLRKSTSTGCILYRIG